MRGTQDEYAFLEPFYDIGFKLDSLESDGEVARSLDHEIRRLELKKISKEKGKGKSKGKKKHTKGVRFASPVSPVASGSTSRFAPSSAGSSPSKKQKGRKRVQISRVGGSGPRSESEPTDDDELLLRD